MRQAMRQVTPQDVWLDVLGQAGRFNRWVYDSFASYLGQRVLEVGCGTGTFSALMAASGREVVALDLDASYAAAANERLASFPGCSATQADVNAYTPQGRFDSVVMLDVLEHLADDEAILRRLRELLLPDGRLILKVPAGRWLHGTLDEAVGHYRRYSRASLVAVAGRAGLAPVVRPWHFNAAAVPGWWLNGRVLRRAHPPAGQVALFERLVPVLRVAERVLPLPLGLSLFGVFRPAGASSSFAP